MRWIMGRATDYDDPRRRQEVRLEQEEEKRVVDMVDSELQFDPIFRELKFVRTLIARIQE